MSLQSTLGLISNLRAQNLRRDMFNRDADLRERDLVLREEEAARKQADQLNIDSFTDIVNSGVTFTFDGTNVMNINKKDQKTLDAFDNGNLDTSLLAGLNKNQETDENGNRIFEFNKVNRQRLPDGSMSVTVSGNYQDGRVGVLTRDRGVGAEEDVAAFTTTQGLSLLDDQMQNLITKLPSSLSFLSTIQGASLERLRQNLDTNTTNPDTKAQQITTTLTGDLLSYIEDQGDTKFESDFRNTLANLEGAEKQAFLVETARQLYTDEEDIKALDELEDYINLPQEEKDRRAALPVDSRAKVSSIGEQVFIDSQGASTTFSRSELDKIKDRQQKLLNQDPIASGRSFLNRRRAYLNQGGTNNYQGMGVNRIKAEIEKLDQAMANLGATGSDVQERRKLQEFRESGVAALKKREKELKQADDDYAKLIQGTLASEIESLSNIQAPSQAQSDRLIELQEERARLLKDEGIKTPEMLEAGYKAIEDKVLGLVNINDGKNAFKGVSQEYVQSVVDRIDQAVENGWSVSFPPWQDHIKDCADAVKHYGQLFTVKSIIDSRVNNKTKIEVLRKIA